MTINHVCKVQKTALFKSFNKNVIIKVSFPFFSNTKFPFYLKCDFSELSALICHKHVKPCKNSKLYKLLRIVYTNPLLHVPNVVPLNRDFYINTYNFIQEVNLFIEYTRTLKEYTLNRIVLELELVLMINYDHLSMMTGFALIVVVRQP